MRPNPLKGRAMHEGDHRSFLYDLMIFSFIEQFIFVFSSMYLATGQKNPSGNYSPPTMTSTQCKDINNVLNVIM
jgi:hypothetical protein